MLQPDPRPTAVSVFVQRATPLISEWLQGAIKKLPLAVVTEITSALDAEHPEFTIAAMLNATVLHCMRQRFGTIDGFWLARAFDVCTAWPINGAFVTIINSALEETELFLLKRATTEWVMKTGVRFEVKVTDVVTFRLLATTRSGTVISITPAAATAVVELFDKARVIVFGEDVESFHAGP